MKRNNILLALIATTSLFTLTTGISLAQNTTKRATGGANGRATKKNALANLPAALKAAQLTPEQQAKMHDLEVKMVDDIKATLTPEQLKSFEDALKSPAAGKKVAADGTPIKANANRSKGGALMTQIDTSLTLTPEQKEKIAPMVVDAQKEILQKMKDARANGADPKGTKQDVMGLQNALKDKIRPLLTPEQQSKLDTLELGKRTKKK